MNRALLVVLLALTPACRSMTAARQVGRVACAAQVAAGPRLDVLTSTSVGTMTLSFDHRALIGRADQRTDCVPATLDGADVRLEPFGNLSSQVCVFPKLMVHAGGQETVLITHCNEREAVGTHLQTGVQVYGHELAYRLPHFFDIPALRTRPARMRYVDEPTDTFVGSRPAFFLEYLDEMLQREGLTQISKVPKSYHEVDVHTLARLHLFEILINNRDWRVIDLTTVEANLSDNGETDRAHNVFLIQDEAGNILPVPFDLELSGFVGVPPGIRLLLGGSHKAMLDKIATPDFLAEESWLVRWEAVRLLHFRRHFAPPVQDAAVQLFVQQASAVRTLVDKAIVPGHTQKLAHDQVEAFYRALKLAVKMPVTVLRADLSRSPGRDPHCKDIPRGTPLSLIEVRGDFAHVRLLQALRLDADPPRPLCANERTGWLPKAAITLSKGHRQFDAPFW